MVLKSANFIVSLFRTIFKYRIIITFLFLKCEHEKLFEKSFICKYIFYENILSK